ncbi:MAG: hypothetical protein CM15mP120_19640 [Pseudomonadota bacterium]|nr:MAG: hypothetical protein CM15mP120_19640 [Pseudomonadota bacterium]
MRRNGTFPTSLSLKYIFGRNQSLYQRITDDDSTYSTAMDRQFYVNHEGDYQSHELQAFYDLGDSVTVTSGIFFYDAEINQRGDFYSEAKDPRFLNADPLSVAILGAGTMVNLYSARDLSAPDGVTQVRTGAWEGDPGGTAIEKVLIRQQRTCFTTRPRSVMRLLLTPKAFGT